MNLIQLNPIKTPIIPTNFHLNLRTRFLNSLKQYLKQLLPSNSICLFKGIPTVHKNYDDIDYKVEQQSTFWYLFGVQEADCYASIQIETGNTVLFIPKFDEAYKMWMKIPERQQLQNKYKLTQVNYTDNFQEYVDSFNPKRIYFFTGIDTDSGIEIDFPRFQYLNKYDLDKKVLFQVLGDLRSVKTQEQIQIMRYVSKVGSEAHLKVMRNAKVGLTQIQLQALFSFQHTIKCGCEHLAYNSICASGKDCAILHYINNDQIIKPGQLLLHDMGGKWYGYCTDQTITFPIDGKFTQKQRQIYNAVYEAQKAVEESMRQGVQWTDMHLKSERVIIQHLIKIGIIINSQNIEELQKKRVGAVFYPHGLGHLIGLKTHDIGGYTDGPARLPQFGLKSLRTRRTLKDGMIITVEPGLYFIQHIIKNALVNPVLKDYLNKQKIDQYMQVGGVRLQDIVVVRKEGIEILSDLPRKAQDVQKWLSGVDWRI